MKTEYPEAWGTISGALIAVAMFVWILGDLSFVGGSPTSNLDRLAEADDLRKLGNGFALGAMPIGAIYIKRLIQIGLEWRRSDGTDS